MRIAYLLLEFPPLSETFIRREVQALCRRGHQVFVYANKLHEDPLVGDVVEQGLVVRQASFRNNGAEIVDALRAEGVDHIRASLTFPAHQTAHVVARALACSFSLTVYSGHDVFTARQPALYKSMSEDPLCDALVVEDAFMATWIVDRLGADPTKIAVIPNSLDLKLYRRKSPSRSPSLQILAVARCVEKKGLLQLVRAFRQCAATLPGATLNIIGDGPEMPRLRAAASSDARIRFLGMRSEQEAREYYTDASVFCLPCVRSANGDADGVPTAVLEAMAYELPVVASDLLSMPHYVRDQREGLLVAPGDVDGLARTLVRLAGDSDLRRRLGRAGRQRVEELCDLDRNIGRLEEVMTGSRYRRWQGCLDALVARRCTYTPDLEQRYEEARRRALAYFEPRGRVLDIGCGSGDMRRHVSEAAQYVGCDPLRSVHWEPGANFASACGEALPFRSGSFDTAVIYTALFNVLDIDAVLAEAARVLRPGGRLCLREQIDDPNPLHLNHFGADDLMNRIRRHFDITDSCREGRHTLFLKASRRGEATRDVSRQRPLVAVAITVRNRAGFIRQCIDSVLAQRYSPIEVCVVDDASTDGTRQILESYGTALRIAVHDRPLGAAGAKNSALRLTSAEATYVAILDSDDFWHPAFVEKCVARLEASPEIGLVYVDDVLVNPTGRELQRRRAVDPWSVETWLRTCNLRGDTWVARRALVMSTRLHDERLSHDVDYDLLYQLLERTTFAHVPEYLAYVREHAGRSTRDVLALAKCHAANLVRYGYSPEYAYLRARRHPEWVPAIEEGIALGRSLRAESEPPAGSTSGGTPGGGVGSSGTTIEVDTPTPLVSCIMPTANRRAFVPDAISYFLRQDYPRKELIVIDDGSEPVGDLIPDDPRLRYVRLDQRRPMGAKHNLAYELARGDIVVHWDDDDWMADWRLSYQVAALQRRPALTLSGLSRLLFFDPRSTRAWLYKYPAHERAWVAGGTFCYPKPLLQRYRFPELNEGADTRFVWSLRGVEILDLPRHEFYVATVHAHNTSAKRTGDPRWSPVPVDEIERLVQGDWECYRRVR